MNPKQGDCRQLWTQILDEIESCWPSLRWRDVGVVIGCSGGADSVALVRAICELQRKGDTQTPEARGFLTVAHFNHNLRGEDSDQDAIFTAELAKSLNLRFELAEATASQTLESNRPGSDHNNHSISPELDSDEASLRSERMRFLIRVAKEQGARYIALAHSADDNAETVLHHLMRGTGPAGLCGIGHPLPIDEDLVLTRPLIQLRRGIIRQALSEQGHKWREDQSNLDCRYTRNWIRNQLVPTMETQFPHVVDAIRRAIGIQKSWRECIDRLADAWLENHLHRQPQLAIQKDLEAESPIVIAAMQQLWSQSNWPRQSMNQGHWEILAEMIRGKRDSPCTLPSGIQISATTNQIHIQHPSI